jgi:uncharacterized metal-binding protein YceD (DUF177 family)
MTHMKIKLNEIRTERLISVAGDEPWLDEIYSYYPAPKDQTSPRLQAALKLTRLMHDQFQLTGELNYEPYLTCGRCGEFLVWPIHEQNIDVTFFRSEDLEQPRNVELSRADLDAYYYDEDELDLESFINEVVQMALPSHMVPEEIREVHVCSVNPLVLEGALADEEEPAVGHNRPFAGLKDLIEKSKKEDKGKGKR